MSARALSLFEGYGVEIEAMVVDEENLDVRPLVDQALRAAAGGGAWVGDVDDGPIGWSNELVAHVVELKNNGPVASLAGVAGDFLASTRRLNGHLAELGARLMPSGMHPWMNPRRETKLWRHEGASIYHAYDELFDCRRHGWANLQSVHLNLSFADEHEFGRLMAAVRLVLPLIPALAASSPVVEGRATGLVDNRLETYRTNSKRVPAMTGAVIPEPIYGFEEYQTRIFGPIDRELEALGADERLIGAPFTNARGAIARFDRMALEVRLIDAQECAAADLAVAAAVAALVRAHVEERWAPHRLQRDWSTEALAQVLAGGVREGPAAPLEDRRYAALFGLEAPLPRDHGALLRRALPACFDGPLELEEPLQLILREGVLAQRILRALGPRFGRPELTRVYGELCGCLAEGRAFRA